MLPQPVAYTGRRHFPFQFATHHKVLLDHDAQGYLVLARNKLDLDLITEIQRYLGGSYAVKQVGEEEFQEQLRRLYQKDSREAEQVAEDLGSDINLSRIADEIPETSELMDAEDDAPVIRLINALLSQAVQDKASDIHIETFEDHSVVRFRIDGVLHEVLKPKRMLAPMLISRLKVMGRLDIAEKRVPQDGRISIKIAGHAVDIRMSTMPSAHGERVVLRLLDKQAGLLQLDQLQMNPKVYEGFKRSLQSPHGILLVTGPTGSGKTTTLYAGLTHINQTSRNILTIEDPVEYTLKGVGQTQVNTKVDMTFARGLRAILRQDPDVVMVGEIRDLETAEIAVQASLTGHLVLSTLHTNTAVGAITRLQDMGVEPFLLSSSLIGVMAQRLVRTLCEHCKQAHQPTAKELDMLKWQQPVEALYSATGCDACNHTGYVGRVGIYELIEIDAQMRNLVHERASEQALIAHARQSSDSIYTDGARRVVAGETTLEELLRVTATS
jgi:general secretion pathway protein E